MSNEWTEIILSEHSSNEIWKAIMEHLLQKAEIISSPSTLHNETVIPDRLLSESAWELWQAFPEVAEKTSTRIIKWTHDVSNTGKAVLILDALSLREMYLIKEIAAEKGIKIKNLSITASECPSSTSEFAAAIGASGRSALANNGKPAAFKPFDADCFTDVYQIAFEDCNVPPSPNVFIWHSWIDDRIHQTPIPDALQKTIADGIKSNGFWEFINNLRQGRQLVITSDHGYATSQSFPGNITDKDTVNILRSHFGARRYSQAFPIDEVNTIPPVVMTKDGHTMVMGQNKWTVQGGYPKICHGGMSLLESLVPWIEMEAK